MSDAYGYGDNQYGRFISKEVQPAAQEVEPSAPAEEPISLLNLKCTSCGHKVHPSTGTEYGCKELRLGEQCKCQRATILGDDILRAASGQAGAGPCSCRHDISCAKTGEPFFPVSAPASQPNADATFAENFFKFSMCAHSILKPECPSCLVGHAARMEMQLSKSEPQLRAELDETFDKYMVERARAEKAEAHLAEALSAPKAPAGQSEWETTCAEETAIGQLMESQGMSRAGVLRQALRTYQLVAAGHAKLVTEIWGKKKVLPEAPAPAPLELEKIAEEIIEYVDASPEPNENWPKLRPQRIVAILAHHLGSGGGSMKCVHCGKPWEQHFEFPWLYCYEFGHERFRGC